MYPAKSKYPDDLRDRFLDHLEDERAETAFVWMNCPNSACHRLIVRGISRRRNYDGLGVPHFDRLDEWIVLPRRAARHVDPSVPEQYVSDYLQAAAILDDSPKASAALSRSVLADLLTDRGGYGYFKLSSRIDAFIGDRANPRPLRENPHYFREIADFGVHTQKDDNTGAVIEVTHEEAEWCFDILDRLFDY